MCTLPGGGQLACAAIVGHDGGTWASSADFPAVTPEEVEAMMKGLDDPDSLAMTGIYIGGVKVRRPAARARSRSLVLATASGCAAAPRGSPTRALTRPAPPCSTSPSAASLAP